MLPAGKADVVNGTSNQLAIDDGISGGPPTVLSPDDSYLPESPPPPDYVEPQTNHYSHSNVLDDLFGIGTKTIDHTSDTSVDAGIQAAKAKLGDDGSLAGGLRKLTGDGPKLDQNDILNLARSANDYGQITAQEWDQIKGFVQENSNRLTPEARQAFETLDIAVQNVGANKQPGFDPINGVVIKGDQLKAVMASFEPPAQRARIPV
jgi:hypothetical protein